MIRALSRVQQKVNHAYRLVSAGRVAPQARRLILCSAIMLLSTLIPLAYNMEAVETEHINDPQALQESPHSARGICSSSKMNGTIQTGSVAPAMPEVGGPLFNDHVLDFSLKLRLEIFKLHACGAAPPHIHAPVQRSVIYRIFLASVFNLIDHLFATKRRSNAC